MDQKKNISLYPDFEKQNSNYETLWGEEEWTRDDDLGKW